MAQDAVLITGTSSGLGLEAAVHLAERGFRVYATMRNLERRGKLDAEAARRNVNLTVLPLDVTSDESIRSVVETIVGECGTIYGLVNNAGVALHGYFEDLSAEEIRHVFETNVFGTMAVTRAVLPHMRAARRGRVVMVTSVGGRMAAIGLSAYCATKFALEGFGESLALELKPLGIEVILLEPGIIKTEIWEGNRNVAQKALDPNSPYYAWFQKSQELSDRMTTSSPITAEEVAKSLFEALTVKNPRLRYLVGRRASLLLAARRYTPVKLFDTLYYHLVVRRVASAGL